MIFDQNGQTLTKHNRSYGAKEVALFWTKRAGFGPEAYLGIGSSWKDKL
jgi:hypothetical protein